MEYRVGTRKSKLAQWQADQVIERLQQFYPDDDFVKVFIQTKGDQDQRTDLRKMSGQGVFVKKIQQALLEDEIDFAIHSAKDLPSIEEEGLVIAAAPIIGSEADCLLTTTSLAKLEDLPNGAVIGTSSLRREFEIQQVLPTVQFKPIRGNIDTRLDKLIAGEYDAIVMAKAAIERLRLPLGEDVYALDLPFITAIGQGIIAVETKAETVAEDMARTIDDQAIHLKLIAERAFLSVFGLGCNVPIGASAKIEDGRVILSGLVGTTSGPVIGTKEGSDAYEVGRKLGYELKERSGNNANFFINTNG